MNRKFSEKINRLSILLFTLPFLLVACGGDSEGDLSSLVQQDVPLTAYSDGPYQITLTSCVDFDQLQTFDDLCTFEELPLLGRTGSDPSNEDIRNRLVVSHQWMGDRFMEMLDILPADIKTLLRSVTAIVIADDIRPSFYTEYTAAIYLDPLNLYLTEDEFNTISLEEDPRSSFSDPLSFISFWRYLKDGGLANPSTETRQRSDLVYDLASLLYHELAHANDFFPVTTHAGLNDLYTPYQASLEINRIAAQLQTAHPISSAEMEGLARVMFRGDTPTSVQASYTAAEVGEFMAADVASDDYAYTDFDGLYYEDVAMLFEELMMKYHFDVDREVAYVTNTVPDSPYCNHYFIGWGQTNRIGDSGVKERARFVNDLINPSQNIDTFIDSLNAPIQSTPNIDWCGPILNGAKSAKSEDIYPTNALSFDPIKARLRRH